MKRIAPYILALALLSLGFSPGGGADQVDFPDIYIDASAGAGGVGSEADPYDQFSDINWTTGGDNSVFDYYAGGPAASVTINLKKGETWRETLTVGHSGTAAYPVVVQAYGSGADPIISGADFVDSATYQWTESGTSNEWYVELSGGGDPSLSEILGTWMDNVALTNGTMGSLNDHEWDWGATPSGESDPAYLDVIDAEDGDVSEWTSVTEEGTSTFTATVGSKNNGSYGFDADPQGASGIDDIYGYKTFAAQDDVYVRFYFKLTADFAMDNTWKEHTIASIRNGATSLMEFQVTEGNAGEYGASLTARSPYGNIYSTFSSLFTLNTWYRIEIRYLKHGSTGGGQLWIDGVSKGSKFDLNTPNQGDRVYIGPQASAGTNTYISAGSIYLDDIIVSTSAIGAYSASGGFNSLVIRDDSGDPDGTGIVIEGTTTQNGVIVNASKDYVTFDGLTIEKGAGSTPYGLINVTGSDYVTIENCTIRRTHGVAYGVSFAQSTYATVDTNIIHDTLNTALHFRQDSTHPTVSNNTIYNIGLVDQNGDNAAMVFGGGGAGMQGVDNATVENNTIYDIGVTCSNGAHTHTQTVVFDRSDACIFRCNLIYNSTKGGVKLGGAAGEHINGGEIYYNIIYNAPNGELHSTPASAPSIGVSDSDDVHIYNNVIYGIVTPASGGKWGDNPIYLEGTGGETIDGILVKNNIVHTVTGTYRRHIHVSNTPTFTNLVIDNNSYYDAAGLVMIAGGSTYASLAAWIAGTTYGDNSLDSDPLMTDPASDDFTLQFGSPCINRGAHVGLFLDYRGTGYPVPIGHRPDIGAYEHKNGGVIFEPLARFNQYLRDKYIRPFLEDRR